MKLLGLLSSALCIAASAAGQVDQVLPRPVSARGNSVGMSSLRFSLPEGGPFAEQVAAFREDYPDRDHAQGKRLRMVKDARLAEEEYHLTLGRTIEIRAATEIGAAWALETLIQLPGQGVEKGEVRDKPAHAFRAVSLDVARRYHSVSTLRSMVRWCQAAKVRTLFLHLTDDQNWMLPSEVVKGVDRFNTHGKPAYTRQEMRDLQAFAAARGVAIVPELDVPGHSSLLVRHDPALFQIQGSASSNCINFGSPKVREVVGRLLDEMAATFDRSPYLHIGGDEAWYPDAQKDPDMAEAMTRLGSGAGPAEVFADFVGFAAERVLARGKTPVVWEGFGRTDFARKRIPRETVVIAWEGHYYPPEQLVADGYRVVNGGWDPLYVVHHYPFPAMTLAPLPRLYAFDPNVFGHVAGPEGPLRTDLAPHGSVMGGLLCWWEGPEWSAHETLPLRILAFGARLWNPTGETDYARFLRRAEYRLSSVQWSLHRSIALRSGTQDSRSRHFTKTASIAGVSASQQPLAFRTDGQPPTAHDTHDQRNDGGVSFKAFNGSAIVTMRAFKDGKPNGEVRFLRLNGVTLVPNLAHRAKVVASVPEDPQFPASFLTDGFADDETAYWLGYPAPCSVTLDLGKPTALNRVDVVPFWSAGAGLRYRVETSQEGLAWWRVVDTTETETAPTPQGDTHRFSPVEARYIRIEAVSSRQFPPSMARIVEVRAFLE